MRRGSMRAREGSHLYWKSASLRRPNQKRSDLFNPPLSKNPYHLKDLQPAELLASVDARLFLPRPAVVRFRSARSALRDWSR